MNIKNRTKNFEKTDILKSYLRDINKIPLLTREKEVELFKEYHDKNTNENRKIEIRNQVVASHQRFVFAIAKRFSQGGDLLPDLVSVGNLGMLEAFDDYDYNSGNRFTTLADYYIRRAINAYLMRDNMLVRPTKNAVYGPKVKKIEADFQNKYNRLPSASEINEILNEDYGVKVRNLDYLYGASFEYIDNYSTSNNDDDTPLLDGSDYARATASQNDYIKQMDEEDMSYRLHKAFDNLTERESVIIKMYTGTFGYMRSYNDREIANELGLTAERVRQIRHSAENKIALAYR